MLVGLLCGIPHSSLNLFSEIDSKFRFAQQTKKTFFQVVDDLWQFQYSTYLLAQSSDRPQHKTSYRSLSNFNPNNSHGPFQPIFLVCFIKCLSKDSSVIDDHYLTRNSNQGRKKIIFNSFLSLVGSNVNIQTKKQSRKCAKENSVCLGFFSDSFNFLEIHFIKIINFTQLEVFYGF
ncbi:UNKNOWN [Stylonychia lemnae]|uniref:Uncharacterized protein n=1 Tax=Stylonychia lemnae TaxID=5949 RepID=A0A078B4V7_STYLE|nr:UNKNOWN [Stylonychia lemnae]|eukprot:CDW89291.1 UNKNOWN [Stylonychia lemnae]